MAYYCQQISVDLSKVLLCDLGIAKLKEASELTITSTRPGPGTVPYMAPEVFVKKRRGVSVDVYSLGCLLVELFGRRRVWPDHDQAQIMMKLLGSYHSPPVGPDISHLSGIRQQVCAMCTQIEQQSRPTIKEVLKVLESIGS